MRIIYTMLLHPSINLSSFRLPIYHPISVIIHPASSIQHLFTQAHTHMFLLKWVSEWNLLKSMETIIRMMSSRIGIAYMRHEPTSKCQNGRIDEASSCTLQNKVESVLRKKGIKYNNTNAFQYIHFHVQLGRSHACGCVIFIVEQIRQRGFVPSLHMFCTQYAKTRSNKHSTKAIRHRRAI